MLLFIVVFFQRRNDNRVNEIFIDCFKYVKLHIYLPCQQSLYNNCSSFASFFTDGHHWTFMKVILWYCFFALILHKGMSSRSWGWTRTKFPTFTVLNDVHDDVLKRKKKRVSCSLANSKGRWLNLICQQLQMCWAK